MKQAILKRFLIVSLLALGFMGMLLCVSVSEVMVNQLQKDMMYSLRLIEYNMDYEDDIETQIDNINNFVLDEDTRLTVIQKDGDVVADTEVDSETLENHGDREEILEAISTGDGVSSRFSETLQQQMLYVAYMPENSEYILRLASPYYGVFYYIEDFIPAIFVSFIVAFLLAYSISRRFSQVVAKPLGEISQEILKINGNSENLKFNNYEWQELDTIVKSTMKLADNINNTISKLEFERNRINYILENMKEGFILLDENQEVLTINQSAKEFLSCGDDIGVSQHIVHFTHNTALLDVLSEVVKTSKSQSLDITFGDENIIEVHIAKVEKQLLNNNSGIVVLMVDVTSVRNLIKMRQEFFSNASHELKTPITSIQGYAELLESGIVNDENQKKEFLARIKKETKNMTVLINDILTISKIENKQIIQSTEMFNVKDIIYEVEKTLKPIAKNAKIEINIEAEDVVVTANHTQIHQLVNNLMTNAVTYNKENGFVRVSLTKDSNNIILVVSDNGIGISPEAQARIFERFYRVDKGRSKKSGGTGLGLAIVKHIVQFYNGTISLESKLDVGTKISVKLPLFDV